MVTLSNLYQVLNELLDAACNDDQLKVMVLCNTYSAIAPFCYKGLDDTLKGDYDNCFNSCVTSVARDGMFGSMRDVFLVDAKERFSKIPKP